MLCWSSCFYSYWYVAPGVSDYPVPETATGFLRNQAWESVMDRFQTQRSRKNSPQTREPHSFWKSKDAFLAGSSCFPSLEGNVSLWNVFPSSVVTRQNRPLFPPVWNSYRLALASLSETVNWFSVSAIWPWNPSILPEIWASEALRADLARCTSPSLLFFPASQLSHLDYLPVLDLFFSCAVFSISDLSEISPGRGGGMLQWW